MKKVIVTVLLSLFLSTMFAASFAVTVANSEVTTLIMGTTDSVESAIDPARAWDFFGWEIIQNTGCTLVEIEPGSSATAEDFKPALATDWTTDGQNWTFTLREGVLFEDGTEFNASHVKYSFDRAIGIAHPEGMPLNMEFDTLIDNVEVVSKYVIKFNLAQPFGPFLSLLACQPCAIVNPEYAGGWKTVWTWDDVVYYVEGDVRASYTMDLGPYRLVEWTRVAGKDYEMRLEANPNYWNKGAGQPKTDVIIIKFYVHSLALRTAIEAGDIDVAFRHISATAIEDLKDDPDVTVWQGIGAAIQYMVFQEDPVGTLPQLNNSAIRRALTACLNRSEVCNTVFLSQPSPLYSIVPDGLVGHTEAFSVLGNANYSYAVSELAALGYNETNKLEIELWYESSGHYPSSAEQAAVYKSQFEASGVVSVTLKPADWPSYREHRSEGTMHVFLYGWDPDYIDPDNYAFLYYAVWLNHHYIDHGEHYAEMKESYDAARASSVESERISLYAEVDNYAVMDCPVVPLWQGKTYAVTGQNIKGVYLDITQSLRMWLLYVEAPSPPPPHMQTFEVVWESQIFHVVIESPSTVSDFAFSQSNKLISFDVSGLSGLVYFCNVTIPKQLLNGEPWMIKVDGLLVPFVEKENETHTFLYLTYIQSIKAIEIIGTYAIPEFPPLIILPPLLFLVFIAVALAKRIRRKVAAGFDFVTDMDGYKLFRKRK